MENQKPKLLEACLGKSQAVAGLVEYAVDSIVSKMIIDKPTGSVTLFAFDKGQKLSEHTSVYDAIVEVVEGRARLTIGGKDVKISAGELIIMPANIGHSVNAEERFKMMLIMIRD